MISILSRKIFFITMLIALVTLMISSIAQFFYFRHQFHADQKNQTTQFIESQSPAIIRAAWSLNEDYMQVLMLSIMTRDNVTAAQYFDSTLSVFEPKERSEDFNWYACDQVLEYDFSGEGESNQVLGEGQLRVCLAASANLVSQGAYLRSLMPLLIAIVMISAISTYSVSLLLLQPIKGLASHLSTGRDLEKFERVQSRVFRSPDELDQLINELKTRTRELRQERSLIDASFPEVQDAIIQTDSEQNIIRGNAAAYEMFGDRSLQNLAEYLPNPEALIRNSPEQISRPNGSVWEVSSTALDGTDQSGYLHVIRDRTEIIKLQAHSLHSSKLSALGTLSSGIAHDYNNILAAITGNAEVLLHDKNLSKKARNVAQSIVESSHRGASLTSRLLQFASRRPIENSFINIRNFVDDMKNLSTPMMKSHGKIICRCETQDNIFVDSGLLENAVMNLLINARDASPYKGDITIAAKTIQRAENSYVCISVTDEGEGIDTLNISKVFDPYFTTKSKDKGTGLGLSMVANFVEQSNGLIEIESKLGVGTTVSILLPRHLGIHNTVVDKSQPIPSLTASSNSKHGRVLLVEDEDHLRRALGILLREAGFQVETASGLPEVAAKSLAKEKWDLVVCDVVLEQYSVIDIQEEFKASGNDAPILLISGNIPAELHKRVRANDFAGALEKPFRSEVLIERIQEIIGNT